MSFAAEVKEELCRTKIDKKCCAQAELYGIFLFCNAFSHREVKIVTGNRAFVKRLPELLRRAFKLTFDSQVAPVDNVAKGTFTITDTAKLTAIRETYGYDVGQSLAHHINFAVVEEEHCRIAFLRGAFLAGGSVNDPDKGYHLEYVTSHYSVGRELTPVLSETGFIAKHITRKGNYVTYFKQSEMIEELLTAVGAPIAAMEVMNTKLEKHLRGSVNRRVNCDAANLDKAVSAAMEQVEAIQRYHTARGLDTLPDKLRQTAQLRLDNPDLTLTQLAALSDPPVTKSCLNHRMRKLLELADN